MFINKKFIAHVKQKKTKQKKIKMYKNIHEH
jgi:hypothetical protein